MGILRSIVYSDDAQVDVDAAREEFPRLEDAIQALEWRISHRPTDGINRKGNFWVFRQRGLAAQGIPEISILYSFTDEIVELHAILIRPSL
jgi:hypothetical protein